MSSNVIYSEKLMGRLLLDGAGLVPSMGAVLLQLLANGVVLAETDVLTFGEVNDGVSLPETVVIVETSGNVSHFRVASNHDRDLWIQGTVSDDPLSNLPMKLSSKCLEKGQPITFSYMRFRIAPQAAEPLAAPALWEILKDWMADRLDAIGDSARRSADRLRDYD